MRAVAIKFLRGFTIIWTGLAVLLILVGMVGIWMTEGFEEVREVFSPFNIINVIAIVVTLLPAIGARALADGLESGTATEAQTGESLDDSIKLIQDYGTAMEAAANTVAVDSSRLPAPKAEIKAAIMRVLRSGEHKQMNEYLKTGYIDLSTFQPGVGPEPIRMLPMPEPIPDVDDKDALLGAAKAITDRSPEYEKWSKIVNDEMRQLVEELREAGFWKD